MLYVLAVNLLIHIIMSQCKKVIIKRFDWNKISKNVVRRVSFHHDDRIVLGESMVYIIFINYDSSEISLVD